LLPFGDKKSFYTTPPTKQKREWKKKSKQKANQTNQTKYPKASRLCASCIIYAVV